MRGAGSVLCTIAALTSRAVTTGSNSTGDYALPFFESLNLRTKFFNDTNRFMADRQSSSHRVFAFENVHVGATDGGCGNA